MPICPMYGGDCVGVDNCAPARFSEFKDEQGNTHRVCPIVSATDAMQALAFSMEPFVKALVGPQNTPPRVEDVGRDEYIKTVIRPEGRPS